MTLTVPDVAGFIANITIMVFPTATPPEGTVTIMEVLADVELACPILVKVGTAFTVTEVYPDIVPEVATIALLYVLGVVPAVNTPVLELIEPAWALATLHVTLTLTGLLYWS
jgi:hypothetical protein